MKRSRVRASLTTGATWSGGFDQHADFAVAEDAGLLGLDDENALQDAAVDERDAEEGVVFLFAGVLEVFEAGMAGWRHSTATGRTCSATRPARPSCSGMRRVPMQPRVEAEGGGEDEIGAIGLKQIGGADVGVKAGGDERDHVHQGVGGLAALFGKAGDFFEGQNQVGVHRFEEKCSSIPPPRF